MENINVYVRLKPTKEKIENNFTYDSNSITNKKTNECFSFDSIITPQTSNKEIFDNLIKNNLSSLLKGINVSIFAYGQTSTGKTFTMKGDQKNEGIISLSIKEIFSNLEKSINKFTLKVSYVEIYNETVNDLLDSSKKNLEIRESIEKGIFVNNISEITVTNSEKAMGLLNKGELNKVTAETKLNEKSSRSHTIFKISIEIIENKKKFFSQLNLVDLAGSENVSKAKCEGLRIKEGGNINKSLLALSNVISKLSQNNKTFVNYRDSKLTRLLQTSLARNSKTTIICTIVDDNNNYSETINTLHFAVKAKNVKTTFKINEIKEKSKIAIENQLLRNKIKLLEKMIYDKKLNKDHLTLNSDNQNIKDVDDLNNNSNSTEQISNLEKEVVLLKKYLMNNEEINSDINSVQGGDVMTVISGGYNNNRNINTSAYKFPYYNFSALRNNPASAIKSSYFNSPFVPYHNYESLSNNNNFCMTEMRKTNMPKTFFHSAVRPQNFIERSNMKMPIKDLDYNNNYLLKENDELKNNIYELKKTYYEVVQSKEQQIKLLNQNHDMTLEKCEKLIKETEVNYINLKSDYDQTLKIIKIKETELNSLKEQTENQSSSINYYKNELNKIKDMNFTAEMETKYNSLLEENIKLKQKQEVYFKLKKENELLKNNVNEMDNKYHEKCQEISKNEKIIEATKKSQEKEIQKFKNEVKNLKNNNIKKKSDTEIIEKIKEYEEKINKLTEENNNYKNNVENIKKTQISEYQKLLDDSFTRIVELNKELNDTKNKNEYLEKALNIAEKATNKTNFNDNPSSSQRKNNNEIEINFLNKKRKLIMSKTYQNAVNKQSSTVSSKQTSNKENDKFVTNEFSNFEI